MKDAVDKNASLVCGGSVSDHGNNFYLPTLLANVDSQVGLRRQERTQILSTQNHTVYN